MKILGLAIAATILGFALHLASGLGAYIDLISIVFIVIPTIAAFVAVGFKRSGVIVARDTVIQVSIVGMLIGYMGIIQSPVDSAALAPALAIMLLVVFYGLIVAGVCYLISGATAETIPTPTALQRVVSVLLWVGVSGLGMSGAPGGIAAFLDLSSLLILGALCLVIAITSASEWQKSLAQHLPVAGFVGVLVGVIGIFQSASDPSAIGPAMAIAFLTLIYCNTISVVLKLAYPEMQQGKGSIHLTYLGFVLLFVTFITAVLLIGFL